MRLMLWQNWTTYNSSNACLPFNDFDLLSFGCYSGFLWVKGIFISCIFSWRLRPLTPHTKWPHHEVYYSCVTRSEVINARTFTSSPPIWLYGALLRHKDNFTLYLYRLIGRLAMMGWDWRLRAAASMGLSFIPRWFAMWTMDEGIYWG
jgi:hypothetical protein